MNVVTCLDAAYALPFFALLRSLIEQQSSAQITLYVVSAGLDQGLLRRIRRSAGARIGGLHFIEADAERVAHLPLQRWISHAAYLKLLAPNLLPDYSGRAIVLDSDVIVRSDLAQLWSADMEDRLLLAVQDYGCPYVSCSFGIRRYKELGLAADAPYFNSGVMLVDLERWRREEVELRAFRHLQSHAGDLRCHDQEALNVVAANRWGELDPRWNQMPHVHWAEYLPESPHRERLLAHREVIVSAPHIVHFAGREKPWLPGCSHPGRRIFLRHLRSSGYLSAADYFRWRLALLHANWQSRVALAEPPGTGVEGSGTSPSARYCALGATGISMGREHVWLHAAYSGVARIVPTRSARLLFSCDHFATLEAHAYRFALKETRKALTRSSRGNSARSRARRLIGRFLLGRVESRGVPAAVSRELEQEYRRLLGDFVRDGFLVADAGVFVRASGPAVAGTGGALQPASVGVLGIPTRDRPELLARALASYAANLRRHGREVDVLVVDDSRLPASLVANRTAAEEVARRYGLQITVLDREWRASYARRLAVVSGLPREAVEFALLGDERCAVTHGAARNALQLLTSGRMVIQVDDDTICEVARVAASCHDAGVHSGHGGMQYWFLMDEEEACDGIEYVDMDFVAAHEELLGASPGELENLRLGGRLHVELGQLPPGASSCVPGADGPQEKVAGIRVTVGGGIGDSGLRNSWFRLFLEGPSFERLVAEDGGYRGRLATRRIVRIAHMPTVNDSPLCVAMNLGLDNRTPLSPFMPVGRMEDGTFMGVLRRCLPYAWSGGLPYAVTHRPPAREAHDPLNFSAVGREFRLNDCLEWLLRAQGVAPHGRHPASCLSSLGRELEEIACLPEREFDAHLRAAGVRALGIQVSLLERRLEEQGGRPLPWVADARRYLAALRYAMSLSTPIVPTDVAGGARERVLTLRSCLRSYGMLLCCWPSLWRAAVEVGAPRGRIEQSVRVSVAREVMP